MPSKAKLTTRAVSETTVTEDNLAKGSLLTHSQLDSNFLNLRDATMGIASDDSTVIDIGLGNTLKIAGAGTVTTAVSGQTVTITGPDLSSYLTNSPITIVGDDSTGITLNSGETLKIAGGTGITTAVSGDTLTITGTSAGSSIGNLQVNDTTLSPINTNSNLTLTANGTGYVSVTGGYGLSATSISADASNYNDRARLTMNAAAADPSVSIWTRGATGSGVLRLQDVGGLDTKIENTVAGLILATSGNNSNITLTPHGTGSVVLDGLNWPQSDGSANYVLKTNGSGQLSWTAQTVDTNTTYSISAETSTGGVNLRLTGSDAGTDDVKLAEGSNITLTRTDANTITIASTGGGGSATGMTFVGDDSTGTLISDGETVKIAGGTGITTAVSGDTITITATGGGGGGSTGDLSIVGSTISSPSNGDLTLTTSGTGRVIIGDDITATAWPSTWDVAAGAYNSNRWKGTKLFFSDLAVGNITSADESYRALSRSFVAKDDGTAKTSNNMRYRIQDQVFLDMNGTNHSSSSTGDIQPGNHFTFLANTGGGTKSAPNLNTAQSFFAIIKGHGGSLTVPNANGYNIGGEIRTQAGDTTTITNCNGFSANIPSTPETGGTAKITNYTGLRSNGNFNANLEITNYTGVDIGGPGNPGGSYVAPTSIKGINIQSLAFTNNYNTWSIYDQSDEAKSKIGFLTIGYDNSDSTGEYRIKPTNSYGRDFYIRGETDKDIIVAPGGTGKAKINNINYYETVYTGGSTNGTITPNVANGNVQKITLDGNITLNAFNTAIAGQSLTLIVKQPSSGSTFALTSTMKWAGGAKTLTPSNSAIDVISIYYDGTDYLASINGNFS